jgi:hypothetical protein
MILKIDKLLQNEIDRYTNLKIGGKNVTCPYYINPKIERGALRVMCGKGSPEEIEHEVKVWAKVKGINLKRLTSEEIRNFMIENHIGIDCSGFIAQILNRYLKKKIGKTLISFLKFPDNRLISKIRRTLRPIENIGANTLTSNQNTDIIGNLNDILPGDLIRAKGQQKNAHHVAIITEVEIDEKTKMIKSFRYANSHRFYQEQNGIRIGEVIIKDPEKDLKDQNWTDTLDGKNFFLEDLLVDYEDNGIRRLKFAKKGLL